MGSQQSNMQQTFYIRNIILMHRILVVVAREVICNFKKRSFKSTYE